MNTNFTKSILFNFGHLGCQNSLPTQECHSTYLPTYHLSPLDLSQWGASFICQYIFLKICPYIFFENLSKYFFENLSIFGKFLKIFLILFENLSIFGKFLKIFLILFFETSPYLANFKDLSNLVKLLSWSSRLLAGAVAGSMDHTWSLGLPSRKKCPASCQPIVNQLSTNGQLIMNKLS